MVKDEVKVRLRVSVRIALGQVESEAFQSWVVLGSESPGLG